MGLRRPLFELAGGACWPTPLPAARGVRWAALAGAHRCPRAPAAPRPAPVGAGETRDPPGLWLAWRSDTRDGLLAAAAPPRAVVQQAATEDQREQEQTEADTQPWREGAGRGCPGRWPGMLLR